MKLPGEELVGTAIEQIVNSVQTRVSQIEETKNREFMHQMKELEFYKSNYEKDLKDIFNYWFDVVRITHIKDNTNLSEQERNKYQKQYTNLVNVGKMAEYRMNTLKYGGKETGRILALQQKLTQPKYQDQPKLLQLFVWCKVLSTLKKDVLGQELDPLDILQVMVNDFDSHEADIAASQDYFEKIYSVTYKNRV